MTTNTLTVRKGYVNNQLVVAHEYNGMDADLSHYTYKGETFEGLIAFSNPVSTETIQY